MLEHLAHYYSKAAEEVLVQPALFERQQQLAQLQVQQASILAQQELHLQ
jgi:hypothetical protein